MRSFGWIKNPLSIIAIFISLIYGISGLLFGFSVSHLSSENQTILVWFVVLFPVAVLVVFAWLVAWHHHKLYGPGDYRADEVFAQTFPTASIKEVAHKIDSEIQANNALRRQDQSVDSRDHMATLVKPRSAAPDITQWSGSLSNAEMTFLLENLAIQQFQREFSGVVRRDVKLQAGLIVDGMIENGGQLIIVEIKVLLGARNWYTFTALQSGARVLAAAKSDLLSKRVTKQVSTLLALIVEGDISDAKLQEELTRVSNELPLPTMIRLLKVPDLLAQLPRPSASSNDHAKDAN